MLRLKPPFDKNHLINLPKNNSQITLEMNPDPVEITLKMNVTLTDPINMTITMSATVDHELNYIQWEIHYEENCMDLFCNETKYEYDFCDTKSYHNRSSRSSTRSSTKR